MKDFWELLKEECCSDPAEAKRCVMVSERNVNRALKAGDLQVVPRQPPDDMLEKTLGTWMIHGTVYTKGNVERIYKAMLKALE